MSRVSRLPRTRRSIKHFQGESAGIHYEAFLLVHQRRVNPTRGSGTRPRAKGLLGVATTRTKPTSLTQAIWISRFYQLTWPRP